MAPKTEELVLDLTENEAKMKSLPKDANQTERKAVRPQECSGFRLVGLLLGIEVSAKVWPKITVTGFDHPLKEKKSF